ncbi:ElyC/SanA/YdcF family protein, partial [uncultured Mameliella sp.]|uniref:YdcF family protein n=1 Tax=uncultured Mameliella sp. TaxID=1447087 RepID=UPI00262DD716
DGRPAHLLAERGWLLVATRSPELVGRGLVNLDEALTLETRALTTEDNMRFARPLLDDLGCRDVVIVTDRYHAARARLVARRAGLRATASCPRLTGAPWWRVLRAWTREAVALVWYWLRGAGR